jgi:hypothetical protein
MERVLCRLYLAIRLKKKPNLEVLEIVSRHPFTENYLCKRTELCSHSAWNRFQMKATTLILIFCWGG